jgi:hypothetical protein
MLAAERTILVGDLAKNKTTRLNWFIVDSPTRMTQLKLRTADLFFGLVDRLRAAATWEFVPLININRDYQLLSQGQLHREPTRPAR